MWVYFMYEINIDDICWDEPLESFENVLTDQLIDSNKDILNIMSDLYSILFEFDHSIH